MRRFITGDARWPDGVTKLGVYVHPDLEAGTGLANMIKASRDIIAEHPDAVALVDDAWLHATVQTIGIPAADIGARQREELADRIAARLSMRPPFTVDAGPPIAVATAVLLELSGDDPMGPWTSLYRGVRTAVLEQLGEQAVAGHPGPPHLTLGYGVADMDSGDLRSALYRGVPGRAQLHVTSVQLVEITQDAERSQYRWETIEDIALPGLRRTRRLR